MDAFRSSRRQRAACASREAAAWLDVMHDQPGRAERNAFAAWIAASPLHVRELLLADLIDRELSRPGVLDKFDVNAIVAQARVSGGDNVIALSPRGPVDGRQVAPRRQRWRRRSARIAAIAAVVLLVVIGWSGISRLTVPGTTYSSVGGEQRSLTLADGTRIVLAPKSRIRVDYSPALRSVEMTRGEASFTVVHNAARPFRVRAGATIVQDVGTRFSVNLLPSGTVVSVTEGEVRVTVDKIASLHRELDVWLRSWVPGDAIDVSRADRKVTLLAANMSLTAGDTAHITRDGKSVAPNSILVRPESMSHVKRLVFRDAALADIVAEFNRYGTSSRIVVDGNSARLRRFSGVFDADDAQSFFQFLDCCSALRVTRDGRRIVIKPRSGTAARPRLRRGAPNRG